MEEMGTSPVMVYHKIRAVAKVAGNQVKDKIIESLEDQCIFTHRNFILKLADFHFTFSSGTDCEPLLIDAIIDDCRFLTEDWEVWADIFKDPTIAPETLLIVSKMLVACVWHTAAGFVPQCRAKFMGEDFRLMVNIDQHRAMTRCFANVLPEIFEIHVHFEELLQVLIIIPGFFGLEMRSILDMWNISFTLQNLFVMTPANNRLLDMQIPIALAHILSQMNDAPIWFEEAVKNQHRLGYHMFNNFHNLYLEWVEHNSRIEPFRKQEDFVYYLSKIMGLSSFNNLLNKSFLNCSIQGLNKIFAEEMLIDHYNYFIEPFREQKDFQFYSNELSFKNSLITSYLNCYVQGLIKIFSEEMLKDDSDYLVANYFSALFFFSMSQIIVDLDQYAKNEEMLQDFVSKHWSYIVIGVELFGRLLDDEHPFDTVKPNYLMYTSMMRDWAIKIEAFPILKILKLQIPQATQNNLTNLLYKCVYVDRVPSDAEELTCVLILKNYCILIQLGVLDYQCISNICDYFVFYDQVNLYHNTLKKLILSLLENRSSEMMVSKILLENVTSMFELSKAAGHKNGLQYEKVRGLNLLLSYNKRITRPLLHFIKKGIDYAGKFDIEFIRWLTMFVFHLPRSKALLIENYFRMKLHKFVRHKDYKYFAQSVGEYTFPLRQRIK